MSSSYAREEEDSVDVNEPIEVGDLSTQQVSDVMDPARKVPFVIKKASVRKRKDDAGVVMVTNLSIDAAIGADGLDGEGKYANKHLFHDFILTFNKDVYTGDWWEKQSRGPTRQFFEALGYDSKALPTIDAELLSELGGKEFIADILRKPIQQKTDELKENGKPKYVDTGEFRNELGNFRKSE